MYKPYSIGRWYRFFIESNGINYKLTHSAIEDVAIVNNILVFPEGYRVMDVITDINSIENVIGNATHGTKIITYDGKQGYFLPDVTTFDYCFIYVFVRRANGVIYTPGPDEPDVPTDPIEPEEIPGNNYVDEDGKTYMLGYDGNRYYIDTNGRDVYYYVDWVPGPLYPEPVHTAETGEVYYTDTYGNSFYVLNNEIHYGDLPEVPTDPTDQVPGNSYVDEYGDTYMLGKDGKKYRIDDSGSNSEVFYFDTDNVMVYIESTGTLETGEVIYEDTNGNTFYLLDDRLYYGAI